MTNREVADTIIQMTQRGDMEWKRRKDNPGQRCCLPEGATSIFHSHCLWVTAPGEVDYPIRLTDIQNIDLINAINGVGKAPDWVADNMVALRQTVKETL